MGKVYRARQVALDKLVVLKVLRHTLTGIVTHQLSTVFWATLYALVRGRRNAVRSVPQALLGGIATSAAAAAIDYTLVPRRLSPGFENRLSRSSMVGVFAAIAGGIASANAAGASDLVDESE